MAGRAIGRRSLPLLTALPLVRPTQEAPSYLGQVATQGRYPEFLSQDSRDILSRVQHYARDDLEGARLFYMNCFGSAERGPGGPARISGFLEYPAGCFTRITFAGGDTEAVVPDAAQVMSDPLPLRIPSGALFREWVHYSNPAGVLFSMTNPAIDAARPGQPPSVALPVDAAVAPSQIVFGATAILATTRRPSVLVVGDSRAAGSEGGTSGNDGGTITPSISASLGYINVAVPGETIWQQLTSFTRRRELGRFCSHVVIASGLNDLNGTEERIVLTNLRRLVASFQQPVFVATIEPQSSGGFSAPDGADQSTNAIVEPRRVRLNRAIRAGKVGGAGVFDLARLAELAPDTGKWKPGFTNDGIHGNAAFARLVVEAGEIRSEMFYR